jgi:hypothetical protein
VKVANGTSVSAETLSVDFARRLARGGVVWLLTETFASVVDVRAQRFIAKLYPIVLRIKTRVADSASSLSSKIELEWTCGHPYALVLIVLAAELPIVFFKWKKWL